MKGGAKMTFGELKLRRMIIQFLNALRRLARNPEVQFVRVGVRGETNLRRNPSLQGEDPGSAGKRRNRNGPIRVEKEERMENKMRIGKGIGGRKKRMYLLERS